MFTKKDVLTMQRLLMAAGSILLLTTVAHPQPFAPHRPAHPAAFILAADDDGPSDNSDASATDNADEGSSATSAVGVTDNGSGDRSPDAAVDDATDESASAVPNGTPPAPPPPETEAPPPGPPPSFATLAPLQGATPREINADSSAR